MLIRIVGRHWFAKTGQPCHNVTIEIDGVHQYESDERQGSQCEKTAWAWLDINADLLRLPERKRNAVGLIEPPWQWSFRTGHKVVTIGCS